MKKSHDDESRTPRLQDDHRSKDIQLQDGDQNENPSMKLQDGEKTTGKNIQMQGIEKEETLSENGGNGDDHASAHSSDHSSHYSEEELDEFEFEEEKGTVTNDVEENGIMFTMQVKLPGFKKELPNYSQGSVFWNQKLKEEMDLERVDAIGPFYCSVVDVAPILQKHIEAGDWVLEVGCGINPMLGWIAENTTAEKLIGCDFSRVSVQLMRSRFRSIHPRLSFVNVDVTKLRKTLKTICIEEGVLGNNNKEEVHLFDVIVDKGTLDCLFCDVENVHLVRQFLSDVFHLLRENGNFIFVSAIDPANRVPYFDKERWKIDHCAVEGSSCFIYTCKRKRVINRTGTGLSRQGTNLSLRKELMLFKSDTGLEREESTKSMIESQKSFKMDTEELKELVRQRSNNVQFGPGLLERRQTGGNNIVGVERQRSFNLTVGPGLLERRKTGGIERRVDRNRAVPVLGRERTFVSKDNN